MADWNIQTAYDEYRKALKDLDNILGRVNFKRSFFRKLRHASLPIEDFLKLKALAEQGATATFAMMEKDLAYHELYERYEDQRAILWKYEHPARARERAKTATEEEKNKKE